MEPMFCPDCRRKFGGVTAYDRHVDRRNDRCRSDDELRARGLNLDRRHIWHRENPVGATSTLPGITPLRLAGVGTLPRAGADGPKPHRTLRTAENAPSPVGGSSARRGLRTASPEAHAPARANANPVNEHHARGGAGADEA